MAERSPLSLFLLIGALLLCSAAAYFFWGRGDLNSNENLTSTPSPFDDSSPDDTPRIRRPGEGVPSNRGAVGGATDTATERPKPAPIEAKDDFGVAWSAIQGQALDRYGAPVMGAQVSLHGASHLGRSPKGLLRELTTGEDGRFSFAEVTAGSSHALRVQHEDYQVWRHTGIQVDAGETLVLEVRLLSGLSVSGRVLRDDDGGPVANAVVRFYDLDEIVERSEDSLEREVRSGPDGHFVVSSLLPGNKRITADGESLGNRTIPHLRLNPATARKELVFRLGAGGAVSGRVFDREGRGIKDATVTAQGVQGPSSATNGMYLQAVKTASDGSFRVNGLIDGLYVLRASKRGYAAGRITLPPNLASILLGSDQAPGLSNINVRPGERDRFLFLEPAPTLSGRVVDEATGQPIRAFCLLALPQRGRAAGQPTRFQNFVDDQGRFEYAVDLSQAFGGDWSLFATAPGYAGAKEPLSLFEFREGLAAPKHQVSAIEVRLSRGADLGGRMVDARGVPLVGIRVNAFLSADASDGADPNNSSAMILASGAARWGLDDFTDEEGRFRINNLPASRWSLRAHHQDLAPYLSNDSYLLTASGTYDTGVHRMHQGGRVFGAVRDAQGEVEEGVKVRLSQPGRPESTRVMRTAIDGSFDFQRVPVGDWVVAIVERRGRSVVTVAQLAGQSVKKIYVDDESETRLEL